MKKIIIASFFLFSLVFVPGLALAQGTTTTTTSTSSSLKNDITGNLKKTGQSANYNTSQEGEAALASLIGAIIKVILGIVGTVLLGLLIYGGYIWMMAGGNDSDVTKAKSIIQQAVIGLIIIVSAYIIADFVMSKLTTAVGTGTTTTKSTDVLWD